MHPNVHPRWFDQMVEPIQIVSILIAIPSSVAALVPLAERERNRRNKFRKIGDFFTARELRGNLTDETIQKFCRLLKHDKIYWSDFYLWTDRNEKVLNSLVNNNEVLVTGLSGVGKTRLVIEVLRHLASQNPKFNNMTVIALRNASVDVPLVARNWLGRKWKNVVLFLDDLEKFVGKVDLPALIRDWQEASVDLRIVATCRIEEFSTIEDKPEVTTLFAKKERVEIAEYSTEEGKKMAAGLGKPFPADFSGTPDYLVLETVKKQRYYETLTSDEKDVLKAVKLFMKCGISSPKIKHLRLVWSEIFQAHGDWDSCFNKVSQSYKFLLRDPNYSERVFIPNVYLECERGVVRDYPSYEEQLLEHAIILRGILARDNSEGELFDLGIFLGSKNKREEALKCFDIITAINPRNDRAWHEKGVLLDSLGRQEEAFRCHAKALDIKLDLKDSDVRAPQVDNPEADKALVAEINNMEKKLAVFRAKYPELAAIKPAASPNELIDKTTISQKAL
jgi:tetratricopeptide (TPR) repeat protein